MDRWILHKKNQYSVISARNYFYRINFSILNNRLRRRTLKLYLYCIFLDFSAEIAKEIHDDSYALTFGTNAFLTMCIHFTLSSVVQLHHIDDVIKWFWIYGGFFLFISIGFSALLTISIISRRNNAIV